MLSGLGACVCGGLAIETFSSGIRVVVCFWLMVFGLFCLNISFDDMPSMGWVLFFFFSIHVVVIHLSSNEIAPNFFTVK